MRRTILHRLSIVLVLWVVLIPSVTRSAPQECDGHQVTISGTDGDDRIVGTDDADVIWAGPGKDVVNGRGGIDRICGGRGDDRLTAPGSQVARGDPYELLLGGRGRDTAFFAGATNGVVAYLRRRGTRREGIFKSRGLGTGRLISIESLEGTRFDDAFYGERHSNTLRGAAGDDNLTGRDGSDYLRGGPGNDTGNGGDGSDRCEKVERPSSCDKS